MPFHDEEHIGNSICCVLEDCINTPTNLSSFDCNLPSVSLTGKSLCIDPISLLPLPIKFTTDVIEGHFILGSCRATSRLLQNPRSFVLSLLWDCASSPPTYLMGSCEHVDGKYIWLELLSRRNGGEGFPLS